MKMIYFQFARMPTELAHGVQIAHMCQAFAQAGLEVELVLPRRNNALQQDIFTFYGVAPTFSVTYLPVLDFVGRSRWGYYLSDLSFLLAVKWYTWGKKIDLFYTRDILAGWLFSGHVLELHALPSRVGKVAAWLWKRASAWVVKTSYIRQALQDAGVAGERVYVAKNGVDLQAFARLPSKSEARNQLGLSREGLIVMYVGSFFVHAWKGVDVLLDAQRMLPENVQVVLVGGAPAEVARVAASYPNQNVRAFSHVPNKEVPLWLRAADVLVLPNKKGYEESERCTSPLKLFEYLASGVPVVASDLPSIREIVSREEVRFVEPNDPQALASGIQELLANGDLAARQVAAAQQKVQAYSWDGQVAGILEHVRSLRLL
jgi:glycosyltransferase involved in cell wall biosynthesis